MFDSRTSDYYSLIGSFKAETSIGRLIIYLLLWLFAIATSKELSGILVSAPIALVILYNASRNKSKVFGVDDLLWFCLMLFFVVGPCQMLENGRFDMGKASLEIKYERPEILFALALVLVSIGSFIGGRRIQPASVKASSQFNLSIAAAKWLVIIVLLAFVGYILTAGGLSNALAPRRIKSSEDASFVKNIFLGFVVMGNVGLCVIVSDYWKRLGVLGKIALTAYFLPALALLSIAINPVNQSRFFILGSWLPIIWILIGRRISYYYFYGAVLSGIIVAMPLMSLTTRNGAEGLTKFSDTAYAEEIFRIKDIDVFNTLCHIPTTVEELGFTRGKSVLSVALFFIPRSFWKSKPTVAGLIVGEDLYKNFGAGTPNLSFYFGGDLYMDFGWLGVIFGFGLVGFFWQLSFKRSIFVNRINFLHLILLGSLPILLRGPLGAVIAYFCCLLFAAVLLFRLSPLVAALPVNVKKKARARIYDVNGR